MNNLLVVMALPDESAGLLERAGATVVYTGLGKINAAYTLLRALGSHTAAGSLRVLNLGTAGSHVFPARTLVECTRFVQHDMDVSPLGFPVGTTPFESDTPPVLSFPQATGLLPVATCHSGDRFVTTRSEPLMEAIDMEAYALAKVCYREQIDFTCIKYISDGADGQAASDWPQTLQHASVALAAIYAQLAENPVPQAQSA